MMSPLTQIAQSPELASMLAAEHTEMFKEQELCPLQVKAKLEVIASPERRKTLKSKW